MTRLPGEHLYRELAPQVLGAVVRRYGDFGAAEDAVQEALAAAALDWPARRRRETRIVVEAHPEDTLVPSADEARVEQDDTLVLLFMCCHPALTRPSAIALTLRAVGGLTTAEIARAFLVPEATMAQPISRAKQSIKSSGIGFAMPEPEARRASQGAVLHVLYLIFNEGYATSAGDVHQRVDLAREAIRLARALHALVPDDGEVSGLLALMLLTDARREARTGPAGEIIPLDEQDRSRWDAAAIAEGVALVTEAMTRGVLMRLGDNPMVALNHAVAVAMAEGPAEGLALLDELDRDPRLADHHRLAAVRGHLLERAGQPAAALPCYEAAAAKTASIPERNYLLLAIARLRQRIATDPIA